MEASREVQARIDKFLQTLDVMIVARRKQAKANYYFSYVLMIATICSSAIAGIGGLSGQFDARLIGALALFPGFLSLAAALLKPQTRANVQYSSLVQLYELHGKLEFGLPDPPSAEDVRKVFDLFTASQKSLDKELAALSFDWSGFAPANVPRPSTGRGRGRDGENSN
jgi:hypothetical protein